MSRPKLVTEEEMAFLREEAKARAIRRSNKELAQLLDNRVTPSYVAQLIARMRREYEKKRQCVDVSCGTSETIKSSGTITR